MSNFLVATHERGKKLSRNEQTRLLQEEKQPLIFSHIAIHSREPERWSLVQNMNTLHTTHQQALHNTYMNLHKQDRNVDYMLCQGQKIGLWDWVI